MIMKVLATGSTGNSYVIIDDNGNCLVIEAYMNVHTVLENTKEAKKYSGWVFSHEHSDHFLKNIAKQYDMYFGKEITEFSVFKFPLKHDFSKKWLGLTCNGFVIQTACKKSILYLTDFYEIPEEILPELSKIKFDLIMIECSYCNFIYKDLEPEVKERLQNHCSDDKCVNYIKQICGDRKNTKILTIHKSERGGRAGLILSKFETNGFKNVRVAVKGSILTI